MMQQYHHKPVEPAHGPSELHSLGTRRAEMLMLLVYVCSHSGFRLQPRVHEERSHRGRAPAGPLGNGRLFFQYVASAVLE